MYTVNRKYKYSIVFECKLCLLFYITSTFFLLNKHILCIRILIRKPVTFGDLSLYCIAAGMPVSYI